MPTSDRCIARAEEAERLAALVSYGRDRDRLTRQAAEWRTKAEELAVAFPPPEPECAEPLVSRLLQRFKRATT